MKRKISVFVDIELYYVCVSFDGRMRPIQLKKEKDRDSD
jgi:hypothetical protein